MRIAIIIDTIEPFYRGGYERRAWELARRLATRHDVHVLTTVDGPRVIDGVTFYPVIEPREFFDSHGYRRAAPAAAYTLGLARLLTLRRRYDVLDCNATPFLHVPVARILARRWKAGFVLSAHEGLSMDIASYFADRRTPSLLARSSVRIARSLYHHAMRAPGIIVCPSESAGLAISQEVGRGVVVSRGGVDHLGQVKKRYKGRITYLGRLVPNKRVDVVIEAAQRAHQAGHISRLTIVGNGPSLPDLSGQACGSPYIKFVADASDEERMAILRDHTDVLVSASVREGISLATLEGLAMGSPVIVSREPRGSVNGALEYVEHRINGFVSNGSVDSIASSIAAIASLSSFEFAEMSGRAIKAASNYLWSDSVQQIETVYESAASQWQ